ASIRLAVNQPINGAGIISRADELRSFAAFYVVTDDSNPDLYSVRLASFKHGKLSSLAGLKYSISIPNHKFHIALQFFSGDLIGQVTTEFGTHSLRHVIPEPPFPGYCGVIRFYNSSAIAQNINIERITMKPILPNEEDDSTLRKYPFSAF